MFFFSIFFLIYYPHRLGLPPAGDHRSLRFTSFVLLMLVLWFETEGKLGCARALHAAEGGVVPVVPVHGGFQVSGVGVWAARGRSAGDSVRVRGLDSGRRRVSTPTPPGIFFKMCIISFIFRNNNGNGARKCCAFGNVLWRDFQRYPVWFLVLPTLVTI